EVDATQEGTEVGNCVAGAKQAVTPALEQAEQILAQYDSGEMLALAPVQNAHEDLTAALEAFREQIIEPCDKTALGDVIAQADERYNSSTEGTADGEYEAGSRAQLKAAIDAAQAVYDDILTRQEEADAAAAALEEALDVFDDHLIKLVVNPDG